VRPAPPEKAATSHPTLLKAIAREVKKRGGIPEIGDNGIDVQNFYRVNEVEETCAPYMVNISKGASLFEIGGFRIPISRSFVEAAIFIKVTEPTHYHPTFYRINS
jgi:uncharacterized protein (DUF362 family)